jgi:hypothetical protein
MIITILEASVEPVNVDMLQESYQNAVEHLDEGIVQTLLLHSLKDTKIWQIVTIWENHQALEKMRQSGLTPRGILIFRAAHAEPTLTIFDVVSQGKA